MEQVNNLREIQVLRRPNLHPNTLMLHEVFFDTKAGSLSLICELMDMNIYELIKGMRKPLPGGNKPNNYYIYQLCKSLDHIHRNGMFHRDVKPENILIKQNTLKLGDFGSCRSIYSKQPHTEYWSTCWYQGPECLLTNGDYHYKIDMWSAGCVLCEITSFFSLFPGCTELDQISKPHDVIGTPTNQTLNKFKQSRAASFDFPFKKETEYLLLCTISLLYAMVKYDPDVRIAAHRALQHPYFQELWAADTQALAMHKKFRLLGNSAGQVPLHLWQISKGSQRQSEKQKACKSSLKHFHLPALEGRGGGY
ncbi:LOW QUALITY PROTEIN: MAPK/MAK/MRK overlapping kinase [Grus americana]|uniref:LOW QUALITY PROTEIN: MAPK/MAK/MRK overlapping kinase n=1 Tax=Grus americana TaxID=9117 RepID=UPI002407BC96|nr:LOW QUALITY PROTEIN: MAPK/MAK/MRK overlapping kinase [Grus americana]